MADLSIDRLNKTNDSLGEHSLCMDSCGGLRITSRWLLDSIDGLMKSKVFFAQYS